VTQQEVMERKEKPQQVGEPMAVLPVGQVEQAVAASMVPGTHILEETMVDNAEVEVILPELVQQEMDDSDDKAEDDDVKDEEEDDVPHVRHSTRIAGGVHKPHQYPMVTKPRKEKDEKGKQAIEKTKVDDIDMLVVSLQALDPVHKEDKGGAGVHSSHLFTVEKFVADSMHDKFKSRMVMNGNEQDTDMYLDRSSPTVAMHVLLTFLAVAMYNSMYVMAKIDVNVVFIQTKMVGSTSQQQV
jgi:hypothetical protein